MPVAIDRERPKTETRTSTSPETELAQHVDFNRITDEQFDIAAGHLNLEPEIQTLLRTPYRELIVQIPVRMQDGRLELFHGYRVQHNAIRGPYKGGLRFHQGVDLMTWEARSAANRPPAATRLRYYGPDPRRAKKAARHRSSFFDLGEPPRVNHWRVTRQKNY